MKHLDKLLHAETNFAIVITLSYIVGFIREPCVWIGVFTAIILSVGKEVWDWCRYGKTMGWNKFSPLAVSDLIADVIGIIPAFIIGRTL